MPKLFLRNFLLINVALASFLSPSAVVAQVQIQPDTSSGEEDFSMYADLEFASEGAKQFCSPKIEGLSPAKLVTVGYDYQFGFTFNSDSLLREYPVAGKSNLLSQQADVLNVRGLRIGANIPVISKNSLVWQLGANYWETQYTFAQPDSIFNPLLTALNTNGLRTLGLNTTVFKPLNDKQFLLFQGSSDYSGDYSFNDLMPLKYLKYSAALIWGKRPHERKQWGVGLARTYRVGEPNYIPVVLFNYTDKANKWGTEVLFPARAHVRRTISSRKLLLFGYELEGQSYRLWNNNLEGSAANLRSENLEIRRGEIRLRIAYEFSLKEFIWMSVQAGYRVNYRFDVDRLRNGTEIYRAFGLGSDAPYAMVNELGNPLYLNISINLVSP
jgi:hypothetical protein